MKFLLATPDSVDTCAGGTAQGRSSASGTGGIRRRIRFDKPRVSTDSDWKSKVGLISGTYSFKLVGDPDLDVFVELRR